jgi:transposase
MITLWYKSKKTLKKARKVKGQSKMIKALDRDTLKRLYLKEKRSLHEIARMYGCSYFCVHYRSTKYGIKLRPKTWRRKIHLDKSVLQRLCVKEGQSSKKIAETMSCSHATVLKRCKEYGIPLKGQRVEGITKTQLKKLYVTEGKTIRAIAKDIGCSGELIRRRCKEFGIPLRNPGTKKLKIDEFTLRRLYVKEGMSMTSIAKLFSCSVSSIYQRITLLGLKKASEQVKGESFILQQRVKKQTI